MDGLGFTARQYYGALKQLLPPGPAWEELGDASWTMKVLAILADELARIDADMVTLVNESDPRTASATLSEWFYEWGIPDECLAAVSGADIELWRKVLIAKICTQGLAFGELVKLIGQALDYSRTEIGTFPVYTVASRVDKRIYGSKWRDWFMTITVDGTNVQRFRADTRVSQPLAMWGDQIFECLVKSLAPCHCGIIFQYGSNSYN